jgi:hydroxyacylglutathione hydrolase
VVDTQEKVAAIVDPGEAKQPLAAAEAEGLKVVALWNTHHHNDHIAGNGEVLARWPGIPVLGSAGDVGRIPELTQTYKAGDEFSFGGSTVKVLEVPGHTKGHIAFYIAPHLFSGDLLFGMSCGAVFEGTKEQMYRSVSQLLSLPEDTLIYCGHEYTLNNCKWAQAVEPDNQDLLRRIAEEKPPTIPLRLSLEKKTNHFLRCHLEPAQLFAGETDPARVFAALRTHKDSFK